MKQILAEAPYMDNACYRKPTDQVLNKISISMIRLTQHGIQKKWTYSPEDSPLRFLQLTPPRSGCRVPLAGTANRPELPLQRGRIAKAP